MLTTLFSLLGGGLMRMLPEVLALLNKHADNGHELAMMDKQIELQRAKGADARETLAAQGNQERETALTEGDIKLRLSQLDAVTAALKDQLQKTGYAVVDVLNFLVRPLVTYFFVGLYGAVKIATIVIACSGTDAWHAILQSWTLDDAATLAGILSFWFVGRVFDKRAGGGSGK